MGYIIQCSVCDLLHGGKFKIASLVKVKHTFCQKNKRKSKRGRIQFLKKNVIVVTQNNLLGLR
jgi:hypothetical protein